jgi:hypothetical protein
VEEREEKEVKQTGGKADKQKRDRAGRNTQNKMKGQVRVCLHVQNKTGACAEWRGEGCTK